MADDMSDPSKSSTPSSPTPAPLLQFLETPRNNVFLKHRKPGIKGYNDPWTDAQYQQAAFLAAQQDTQNETTTDPITLQWSTAGQTHFGDRYYSARLTSNLKRMLNILIFRHGKVPEHQLTMLINMLPDGCVNGGNFKGIRAKLAAHNTQAKANTQSFLYLSMKQLLIEVPGFRNATDEARKSLLVRMCDQAKIVISENPFYVEAQSVDFANIFRANDDNEDDVRTRWQTLLRTRFVDLAMKTYETRILDENDSKGARNRLGAFIDNHMSSPSIVGLYLGSYKDVPTTAHRSIANKRHMAKLVVEDED